MQRTEVRYAADSLKGWKLDMQQTEGLDVGYAADKRAGSWTGGGWEIGYTADRRAGIQSKISYKSFVAALLEGFPIQTKHAFFKLAVQGLLK